MMAFSLDIEGCADQHWLGRCRAPVLVTEASAFWLLCHLAQHWPEDCGSCSDLLTNGSLFSRHWVLPHILFFLLLNKMLSHHRVSSDVFQNSRLRIAS